MDVQSIIIDVDGDAGDHVLIEGEPGKIIRVWQGALTFDSEVDVVFKSGSTPLTGPMKFYPGGAFTFGMTRRRWLMSAEGESIVMNLSAACKVGGAVGASIS